MVCILANQATEHALTQSTDVTNATMHITNRYSDSRFIGIMIDTGAARVSTARKKQYQAYSKAFGQTPLDTTNRALIQFRISTTPSIGAITVRMPIGIATFHVVDADTPFLLCLQDMDK
jgi:hypothetical protein